jgi:hypothetical protein
VSLTLSVIPANVSSISSFWRNSPLFRHSGESRNLVGIIVSRKRDGVISIQHELPAFAGMTGLLNFRRNDGFMELAPE